MFINDVLMYMEFNGAKMVSIQAQDLVFLWFCDDASSTSYNSGTGSNLQANKWYYAVDGQTFTEYTGSSPINLASLNIQDSDIESYVTRVINSFSNNG